MTITRVIQDAVNPSTVLNIIDDGTGAFGTVCPPTAATPGDASSSATICECSYAYNSTSAPNQKVFTPITYHEQDMARCSYAGLPSDVTSVQVSIHVTTTDTYSSAVTFNFSGTGNTLDTTNPNSFIQPLRYQCRDVVYIPYIFDGASGVYDPFQSEDPHLSYPIDFYASNLGAATSQYVIADAAAGGGSSWNCPPILNPSKYMSGTNLSQFYSNHQLNMTVFSSAPLAGNKVIYPPSGGFDRSTFYIAKSPSGVFTVPVNSILAPGVTTASTGTVPPLGYAANPIPIGSGTGQETCPDTTTSNIPPNYHWVKVWLFRAGLPSRQYAVPGGTGSNISQVGSISCNPGQWADGSPVFSGCPNGATGTYNSGDISSAHPLADRALGSSSICVRFDDRSNPTTFCNGHPGPGCSTALNGTGALDPGFDSWLSLTSASGTAGCQSTTLADPLSACNGAATTPISYNVGTANFGTPRYDYLFVVSPPSIMLSNMQDTSSSSPGLPYHPYRFYTNLDCLSPDPDSAPAGDCLQSNAITNYGLKLYDVGSAGDPPAADPNRAGIFPMCAIQPN